MKRILLVFILAAAVMYGILHGNLWRNNLYWYGDALFNYSANALMAVRDVAGSCCVAEELFNNDQQK